MPQIKDVIKKWYKALGFPKEYDNEFYRAIEEINAVVDITLEQYDKSCNDGIKNLIYFLYYCEKTAKYYKQKHIPNEILVDTLKDIVTWTIEWSDIKGSLYLGELLWLTRHLSGRLFKIGRLQFCIAGAEQDILKYGLKKGDNVIEIHIPKGGKLDKQEVQESIENAKIFFEKYFEEYSYDYFICHSWLLDESLKKYLSQDSNILKFGDMFDKISADKSNAIIRYLFRWDTNEENLLQAVSTSNFASKIQKAVLDGEQFYETLGVIKK